MRYGKVSVETLAYELGPNVVASRALEDRLAPLYQALRIAGRMGESKAGRGQGRA